jgi:hypothetical protein
MRVAADTVGVPAIGGERVIDDRVVAWSTRRTMPPRKRLCLTCTDGRHARTAVEQTTEAGDTRRHDHGWRRYDRVRTGPAAVNVTIRTDEMIAGARTRVHVNVNDVKSDVCEPVRQARWTHGQWAVLSSRVRLENGGTSQSTMQCNARRERASERERERVRESRKERQQERAHERAREGYL